MHYYKRNLGDYAKKAGRLSMMQHGAYTLLMDACYDREQFPTLEEALDWTWASSKEEVEAVEFVLKKFFVLEGDVYVQPRIKEELEEYQSKSETNKRIAREREAKRKEKETNANNDITKRERTVHESSPPEHEAPPNQEPLTINHKPNTPQTPQGGDDVYPDDFVEFWEAYPKKIGKGEAFKRWKKIKPSRELRARMLWAVEQQKRSPEWTKNDGQFIPNPGTWLNQSRWGDEVRKSTSGGFVA